MPYSMGASGNASVARRDTMMRVLAAINVNPMLKFVAIMVTELVKILTAGQRSVCKGRIPGA